MELRLRFPPKPEFARRFAEEIVVTALEVSKVTLDFSPRSLEDVDAIVQGFVDEGLGIEDIAETLFSFGCYVGEVFVRHHAGKWVATEESAMKGFSSFPFIVAIGSNGKLTNPIGKVFKRFENGAEDNLPYYYQVFSKPD
ncbi:MAG: hypothetical protein ACXWUG_01165 [Polyangiales bacterium]